MIFVTFFAGYLLALALIIVGGMIVGIIVCIGCLVGFAAYRSGK